MKNSIFKQGKNGEKTWVSKYGDHYVVTGFDRESKWFTLGYDNWLRAMSVEVWHGSTWLCRGGKHYLITRV